MKLALMEAQKAEAMGEVPIGAVVVRDGEVVGRGHNRRETGKNALYHAELLAMDEACRTLGGWRLFDCDLYVTLEPCPMCAGAAINARIRHIYFGARDPKGGAVCSVTPLLDEEGFNHQVAYTGGILKEDCGRILTDFFARLRQQKKEQ